MSTAANPSIRQQCPARVGIHTDSQNVGRCFLKFCRAEEVHLIRSDERHRDLIVVEALDTVHHELLDLWNLGGGIESGRIFEKTEADAGLFLLV
jgi:hypothetical protein